MSAENPAVPLSSIADGDELFDALTGGGPSAAGVRVNRKRALGLATVWRAVGLIAGDVARLPFRVYRQVNTGGKTIDPKHAADRLIAPRRKPCPEMGTFVFRQTIQAHALLTGNGYAAIERDQAAKPTGMFPLDPECTHPVRMNGQLWYVTEVPGEKGTRETRRIQGTDVLHIRGLSHDGLSGYPVLKMLREEVGKAIASRDYGSRFFSNDARPGVVLEVPASMKDAAARNLLESWNSLQQGVKNAHRAAILREGVVMKTYGTNAKDAQLTENLVLDARSVANIFGVPAHKIGDRSQVAYNSLESENDSYHDDTLDRWLNVWEDETHDKLLTEREKESGEVDCLFTRRQVSRAPLATRGAYYSQAINGGWMCPDEARDLENLNPIPDGSGAVFTRPVNVAPATSPADPPPDETPAADPPPNPDPANDGDRSALRAALRSLAADTFERMARRLLTHAERRAKRPAELREYLGRPMAEEHGPTVAAAVGPVLAACRATGRITVDPDAIAERFARELCHEIRPLIGFASDLPAAVSEVGGRWVGSEAKRLALELFPE